MESDLVARFWSRVDRGGECWEWLGSRLPRGYGTLSFRGKQHYAHRVSVMISGREIPPGMVVMHKCDNPPCVRPDHLDVGTTADNRQDCAAKGRNPLNGNHLKTHCKRGHNLAQTARMTGRGNQRVCTACEAARLRRRAATLRAQRESVHYQEAA